MGLKEDRLDEWARHYDILLWTVTTIFLVADGTLLVYCSESKNFRTSLALGGILFNLVTVYLVASMRELRHLVESTIDKDNDLSSRRKLIQWRPFISIFLLIAVGWFWLLLKPESTDKRSEMQWRPMKSASPDPCPFTHQVREGVGKPNRMFRDTSTEPTIDGVGKTLNLGVP